MKNPMTDPTAVAAVVATMCIFGTQAQDTADLEDRSTGLCSNGDVMLAEDGAPFIFWNNQWSPICGHYFWDNQDGATLFCQKMGYHTGTFSGRGSGQKYTIDSFRIGRCNSGDTWENCQGGCNDYESGGACSNKGGAKCDKNQGVKITINCDGGNSIESTSCSGCTQDSDCSSGQICKDYMCVATFNGRLYFIYEGITDASAYINSGGGNYNRVVKDIEMELSQAGIKIKDLTGNVLYEDAVDDIKYVMAGKSGIYFRYLHGDALNGYTVYLFSPLESTEVLDAMQGIFSGRIIPTSCPYWSRYYDCFELK